MAQLTFSASRDPRKTADAGASTPADARYRGGLFGLAATVVAAIHLAYCAASLAFNRVGFDTAYNLSVPRSLAAGDGYTSTGILHNVVSTAYDFRISTGPTVLAPLTAAFASEEHSLLLARLIMCGWYVALAAGLAAIGWRAGGRWWALALSLSPLTINVLGPFGWSELMGPTDVLGEIAVTAFIAWAVALLGARWRGAVAVAGALAGLALVTKIVAAIAMPALVLAVVLAWPAGSWWRRGLRALVFAASAAVPGLVWQAIIAIDLGAAGYDVNLSQQRGFILYGGSGLTGEPAGGNLAAFFRAWWTSELPSVAVALATLVWLGVVIERNVSATGLRMERNAAVALVGLGGAGAAWALWWTFLSTGTYTRAVYPGLVLLAASLMLIMRWTLADLASRGGVAGSVGRILGATGALVLAGSALLTVSGAVQPVRVTTLAEQRSVGAALDDGSGSFSYIGLTDQAQRSLDPFSVGVANGLEPVKLVEGATGRVLIPYTVSGVSDPANYADLCAHVLFDDLGVTVCELPAG